MSDKYESLVKLLKDLSPFAIAFSGGVDSSFLAAAAEESCGEEVVAITVQSEFQAARDIDHAIQAARKIGIRHSVVKACVMQSIDIVRNGKERCYFCKQLLFSVLKQEAADLGIDTIVHGVNLDNLKDFRPGFRAAEEMGVVSVLVHAGLSKKDIRYYSKKMGLDTWDMPSQSYLATRIPYDEPITRNRLAMIEKSEGFLYELGFGNVRVRCHQDLARIELDPDGIREIESRELKESIVTELKKIGFSYVTVDLEGYVTGSMNRVIV